MRSVLQYSSLRATLELLTTLFLNAVLILFVVGIRQGIKYILIETVNFDIDNIEDRTTKYVVLLSQISTIILLAIYIFTDILRHIVKSIREIKEMILKKHNTNKTDIE